MSYIAKVFNVMIASPEDVASECAIVRDVVYEWNPKVTHIVRSKHEIGIIEGGCLCAAIRYRITSVPLVQSRCHCNSCRRASGAPSVAWVVVHYNDFTIVSGRPSSSRSSPQVVRTFCGTCGTPLTYQHDDSLDTIDVTTATLDRPEQFAPTREIWIEHRIPWEILDHNLRHYPRSSIE